ncbi:MAG: right-handed parallel beta-helix repeat-containing protein [Bacteroidetes bacterium]|nr:right-handed parallel beta-helix repeat-containing protein [Bacteroidota bacterium]
MKNFINSIIPLTLALAICGFLHPNPASGQTSIIVEPSVNLIEGTVAPYNAIHGGDTLLFRAGNHDYLLIRNLSGEPGKPIVMINFEGTVIIDTDHHFGVSIENCRYFKFTGSGFPSELYGFRIQRVKNGGGFGIGNMSSDFEIDHVYIANVPIGGIYAKTDPDCTFANTRDKFTQRETRIHDNYLANIGNEAMYIGSTKYFGQSVHCDDLDTLLMPSLLDGVYIYNNIINVCGWDGIQVSSASSNCRIYDNLIMYDSQAEQFGQMAGILLGGGSKCDCYNNNISHGKGNGIESHGLGGYRIFNNVIIDAGKTFKPNDTLQMKYGIYLTDVSVHPDSSFNILFNDIINPKSDGIRFASILSSHNKIVSNAIINPGNFDYYERNNFTFKGRDSYIMIPDKASDILVENNYFARNADQAGFENANYSLLPGSPLIDAGYRDNLNVEFDFYNHTRPYNGSYDIGAFEFNPAYLSVHRQSDKTAKVTAPTPNPVRSQFRLDYRTDKPEPVCLWILNFNGKTLLKKDIQRVEAGDHIITAEMGSLPDGAYLYRFQIGLKVYSGKFLKIR